MGSSVSKSAGEAPLLKMAFYKIKTVTASTSKDAGAKSAAITRSSFTVPFP